MLSRSEITKYDKPKPGGGGRGGGRGRRGVITCCGASDASGHVDEPDFFGDAEPSSMPAGPGALGDSDAGPLALMPDGPVVIAMLGGP